MYNAIGEVIPLVLLVACKDMSDDAFEFVEINDLSHTATIGAKGYLCFTKTRAGNKSFYHWFFARVIVGPLVKLHDCKVYFIFKSFYLLIS